MRESNQLICEKLQITNDLNQVYCDIFDGFMNQNIGQKIDYISIFTGLNDIKFRLNQEIKKCKCISTENNEKAKNIITALMNYQKLFNIRINTLINIVTKLHNKAECTGKKYSIFTYKSDLKSLNKLENQN